MRPSQPVGRFDDASGEWILTELWSCRLSRGRTLIINPGFASDGASVPRFLWPVVGPRYAPETFPAALVHDALYAAELLPRKECDTEFQRLLLMGGVKPRLAYYYYVAVRAFGWAVWARHTQSSIAEARKLAFIQ